mgnify:FL=1
MKYNPRYYRLDIIPEHRLAIIDIRLKGFIDEYKIKKWPVDAVQLLKKIKKRRLIDLEYAFVPGCSTDFDAEASYYPVLNYYYIAINKNMVLRYPFRFSSDRRLNFTLAHEFGHIFLDHLIIPKELKTSSQKQIEEEEANEFAGRLLMPERLILTSNFVSQKEVAKSFNVSDQALWKRLNHLKRLDLLKAPVVNVCENCGNNQISPAAEFCPICGEWIVNKNKGVMVTYYNDGYEVNERSKVLQCPVCENEEMWDRGEFCRICSKVLINSCTYCETLAAGNSRYCELCGSETTFYQAKYLSDWQTAKARIEGREAQEDEWASLGAEISWDEIDIPPDDADEAPF